jgi:hypothetical protein
MDRILQSLTRLPLAVALLAAVLMTGCDDDQPDEEQLVVGLGHALSAETESEALVSDAVRCACGPTCVIAVKQHIRGDVLVRFGWEIGSALAEGALKALPLADKTKEAIEAGLEAVDAGVALGMHGDFVRTVEWDQNPTYEINKTCNVKWYAIYDPSSKEMRVIAECDCTRSRGSPCSFEYSYKVRDDGTQVGPGQLRYP